MRLLYVCLHAPTVCDTCHLTSVARVAGRCAMAATDSLYSIRPSFAEKFRPATVKTLIGAVLADKLADKS